MEFEPEVTMQELILDKAKELLEMQLTEYEFIVVLTDYINGLLDTRLAGLL